MSSSDHPLPDAVLAALQRRNVIEAIKLLRESTGLGLKEAKDIIDQHMSGSPAPLPKAAAKAVSLSPAVAKALQRGNKIEAIRLLREESGLGLKEAKDLIESFQKQSSGKAIPGSPGQVAKSGGGLWTAAAVAALTVVAYYFFIRQA